MPGGDRTGPLGFGPMSGRAAGWCAGFGAPGYMNRYSGRFWGGRGFGRGFGMGRGMGNRWRMFAPFYSYGVPYPPQDEAEMLRQEAQHLEASLEEINKRLTQLEESQQGDK